MNGCPPALVLASNSAARRAMFDRAGVPVEAVAPHVDEAGVKRTLRAEGASALETAMTLSELKAARVSRSRPGALVLGADQMLECEGRWFDKSTDRAQAAAILRSLSAKTHHLTSGAVIVRDGRRLWGQAATARLAMRALSDGFIDWYLDHAGEAVFESVGAYRIEDLGAHLFLSIEGDCFTILGLPFLQVLNILRIWKVAPA